MGGVAIGLLFLILLGAVYAATVHYVGGKITNLGSGSATDDAITMTQADTAAQGLCMANFTSILQAGIGTSSGNACTSCSGWVMHYEVYGSSARGNVTYDGITGVTLTSSGARNNTYLISRFTNNLSYELRSYSGVAYINIDYCLE